MKWTSRKPVAFQAFTNTNFGKAVFPIFASFLQVQINQRAFKEVGFSPDLTAVLAPSRYQIHPRVERPHSCSLMLLSNLAEIQWLNVPCFEKLLPHVLCFKYHTNNLPSNRTSLDQTSCPVNFVVFHKLCYLFLWYDGKNSSFHNLPEMCRSHNSVSVRSMGKFKLLDVVMEATSANLSPLLFQKTTLTRFTYEKYSSIYNKKITRVELFEAKGFHICKRHLHKVKSKENTFHCSAGGYISELFYCDEVVDCPNDNSDENHCICTKLQNRSFCKHVLDSNNLSLACGPLFERTHSGDCSVHITVENIPQKTLDNNETFACATNSNVFSSRVNDLIPDCEDQSDEQELMSLLMNGTKNHCHQMHQTACTPGHSKCFNISDLCTYILDVNHDLMICRNGAHLANCKDFECNAKYKCHKFYCIPWSYVCDGKVDCPNGDDEKSNNTCGNLTRCANMFKCKHSKYVCVHLENVCDGRHDCPLSDDEILCQLTHQDCPNSCNCLALSIVCKNATFFMKEKTFWFVSVTMQNTPVYHFQSFVGHFQKSVMMKLHHNLLKDICKTNVLMKISIFDISQNKIILLQNQCFQFMPLLIILKLDSNSVSYIESEAFCNLNKLRMLDLSNNPLTSLPPKLFAIHTSLVLLFLTNVHFPVAEKEVFKNSEIEIVVTNYYLTCCFIGQNSLCTGKKPSQYSCGNLLPNETLSLLYLTVSLLILSLSIASIAVNLQSDRSKHSFVVLVISVNVNDILFCVYVSFVWMSDKHWRELYVAQIEKWQSGVLCMLGCFFSLLFTMLSQCLQLFFSYCRLMIVIKPFTKQIRTPGYTFKAVSTLCVATIVVAALLTFFIKYFTNRIPNNLCSPFIDDTKTNLLTTLLIWFTAVSQILTLAVLSFMHCWLLVEKSKTERYLSAESTKKIKGPNTDTDPNLFLKVQMFVVSLSHMLCWLPASIAYIASSFMTKTPYVLLTWVIVTIVPLSSVLNPSMFLFLFLRNYATKTKPRRLFRLTRGLHKFWHLQSVHQGPSNE